MKHIVEKLDDFLSIRRVSGLLIFLNIISIVLGVLYVAIEEYYFIWDVFGVILLMTIFGNILLVFLDTLRINRKASLGNLINILGYIYLVLLILSWFYMIFISKVIIYISYFGMLGYGLVMAMLNYYSLHKKEEGDISYSTNPRGSIQIRKVIRMILGICCFLLILVGIYASINTLFGSLIGFTPPETTENSTIYLIRSFNGVAGIFMARSGITWAFISLSTTVLLLKTFNRYKHPKRFKTVGVIGLVMTGIFLTPLILVPYSVYSAERNFSEAFGDDWRDDIPNDIEEEFFLKTYYTVPMYFLGVPTKDCKILKDIKYHEDGDLKLYFDVCMPKEDDDDLPGKNSVIISIHGGAWAMGDKGTGQWERYFAAQGYVVFSIQYGLYEDFWKQFPEEAEDALGPPENVQGDFDIDDMAEQIGIFTKYLVNNSEEYNANLDSVFIAGESAGGQLTCLTALAIASGEYNDIFASDNLTIKGYVPFYPANRKPKLYGLDGKEEFIDPAKLVEKDSPPCLIFMGTSDGMVHPSIIKDFKKAYEIEENKHCAILWAYLGGHAADSDFNEHYNMIFLFYLERFLYLCVNDKIVD
ncbi:MAG: alpha/beta hydrolase [Promethearchaeota archaeon]|nr:MAG: alpha/beta hydrolase [Candidatus Lokiarchaeota archaeon]